MGNRIEQIMVKMGFDVSEASKVNDAMNKVNEAAKKGGEGMAGFNAHGRETRELMHKIGEQSPILGAALKAALSPEAIGVIALTVAFEFLRRQVEKIQEKIKDLTRESEEMFYSEADARAKAAEAMGEYHRKVAEAMDSGKQAIDAQNRSLEQQLNLIAEISSGHDKVIRALNQREDEGVRRQREAQDKNLTPAQREALQPQREFEDAKRARARQLQEDEAARAREQAERESIAKKHADATVNFLTLNSESEALHQKTGDQNVLRTVQLGSLDRQLEENKKAQEKADEEVNKRGGGNVAHNYLMQLLYPQYGGATPDDDKFKEAQANQKRLQDEYTELLKKRAETQRQINDANAKVTEHDKDTEERKAQAKKYGEQLDALNQRIGTNETTRQQLGAISASELDEKQAHAKGQLSRSEQLGEVLAGDSTLQMAKDRITGTSGKTRDYWQKIIDERTAYDRSRFGGVLTPDELKNGAGTAKDPVTEQTDYLRRIADAVEGNTP